MRLLKAIGITLAIFVGGGLWLVAQTWIMNRMSFKGFIILALSIGFTWVCIITYKSLPPEPPR